MTYWALFAAFARVGLFGFGGGPSMIPLLQAECVGRGLLTDEQFLEGLAAGNALPGPIATKMAVYVGWEHSGLLGAVVATAGMVLPSSILMVGLGSLMFRYKGHPAMDGALNGVKPALVGLLAFVAFDLAPSGIVNPLGAALAVGAFAALVMQVHPAVVIGASALVGVVLLRP